MSCCKKSPQAPHSQKEQPIQDKALRGYLNDLAGKLGNGIRSVLPFDTAHPLTRHFYNSVQTSKSMQGVEDMFAEAYEAASRNLGRVTLSRRDYLKATLLATTGSLLPFTASCSGAGSYHDDSVFAGPGPTDVAKVGIARGSSIEESVRQAIDLAGGLEAIGPGESVVIKPNCVWYSGKQSVPTTEPEAPATTSLEVLRAVIRAVKERNGDARNIFIADHSASFTSTPFVMMALGLYGLAMEEGVRIMPWDLTRHIDYSSDKFNYLQQRVRISETVLNFDHFINVPVLKNHNIPSGLAADQPQYTCCLKALVGVMQQRSRSFGPDSFHSNNLPEHVAELNLIRPYTMKNGKPGITMNIVDATKIIVDGGAHNSLFYEEMKVAAPDMIIASTDRIACDSVALSVLKHYGAQRNIVKDYMSTPVWQQRQIIRAAELNLGISDTDRIDIQSSGIDPAVMASISGYWQEH